MLRIRNPNERALTVWLEPWAERHQLEPRESLEIIFVGPDTDHPTILSNGEELAIYGWNGSEAVVLRDGHLASPQPTVDEIVRQELEIVKDQIRFTIDQPFGPSMEDVQRTFDTERPLARESWNSASKVTAFFVSELASTIEQSDAAISFLWQIISRLVRTRGYILAAPDSHELASALWSNEPGDLVKLIRRSAKSILPKPFRSELSDKRATPRSAESESGPTPR
jgi:hypothetical protein